MTALRSSPHNQKEILTEIHQLEQRIAVLKQLLPSEMLSPAVVHQAHIDVYIDHKIVYLAIADIICIKGESNYSTIYFISRPPVLTVKTLKYWQEKPSLSSFKRVHKSFIINPLCIASIQKSTKTILLYNDIAVRYSKSISVRSLVE